MLKRVLGAALIGLTSFTVHAEAPRDLALVCQGLMKGTWKVGSDGTLILGPNGQWLSGGSSQMRYAEIPTIAEFRITGGEASLFLPQPPSCGICTGETGWRNVKRFQATESRFSGKVSYGPFSGTSFEIDRRTGRMISKNGFDGVCSAIDLGERKF